jgi:hypothetical protein
MLLRLYTSSQPLLLISLPVLAAAGLLPFVFLPAPEAPAIGHPAPEWFAFLYQWKFGPVTVAWLLVSLGALRVNVLFNRHEFYPSAVYIPGFIYTISAVVLLQRDFSLNVLLANVCAIAGIDAVMRVSRQARALPEYFRGGFWLGCAALCYPPFLALGIAIWVSIIFLRPFSWREYAVSALAFVSPFMWWAAVLYLIDNTGRLWLFEWQRDAVWWTVWAEYPIVFRILLILMASSLALGLPRLLFPTERATNKARNLAGVFLVFLIFFFLTVTASAKYTGVWNLTALLVPFSLVTGVWYAHYRYSLFAPFVFYAWLISSALCIVQYAGLLYL